MQMPGEELKPDRESALFTSEQRYRTLVETMGDGLSEIDEHQVTTYANETLCRMWGRSGDEIIGQKVDQFLDDENRKILLDQLEKRRKGGTDPYEIVWIKKDGSRLHSIMTPTPYFDADGRFKGSFAVVTDISTQKKEKNLLELRVRQRTKEIENKTQSLEEVNTALRALLKKREEDKTLLEERMCSISGNLSFPTLRGCGSRPWMTGRKGVWTSWNPPLKTSSPHFCAGCPWNF